MLLTRPTFVNTNYKGVDISSRINQILSHYDVSMARFATKCGLHYNTVRKIAEGSTASISTETVDRICSVYTDISRSWLQYGEGQMLVNKSVDLEKVINEQRLMLQLQQDQINAYKIMEELRKENDKLKAELLKLKGNKAVK